MVKKLPKYQEKQKEVITLLHEKYELMAQVVERERELRRRDNLL